MLMVGNESCATFNFTLDSKAAIRIIRVNMATNSHTKPSLSARDRRRLNKRLEALARAESRALAAELRAIRAERETYQNALYAAFMFVFGILGCIVSFVVILSLF